MKKEKKTCPTCGALMMEYKRNFSRDLGQCIKRIAEAGGVDVDVADLYLTNNQYANFQRLRFWGLIEKVLHEDDHGKGGHWSMTKLGWAFVSGRQKINKYAITYRGDVKRLEGEAISIREISEGWWYKPKVIEESRPHDDDDPQMGLC